MVQKNRIPLIFFDLALIPLASLATKLENQERPFESNPIAISKKKGLFTISTTRSNDKKEPGNPPPPLSQASRTYPFSVVSTCSYPYIRVPCSFQRERSSAPEVKKLGHIVGNGVTRTTKHIRLDLLHERVFFRDLRGKR